MSRLPAHPLLHAARPAKLEVMRARSFASRPVPAPRAALLALAVAPAAVITALMSAALLLAPWLGPAGRAAVTDTALLANLAVWFAFSPPFLVGWVQVWEPEARARTGTLGVAALACVLWFFNLFVYACTGSLVAGLLR